MKKISTAVIQINAGPDKKRNLDNAARLIKRASRNGARLVALPELFNWRGTKKDFDKNSEPLSGCTYKEMSDLASSLNIFIHCGSILEANPRSKKPFNTSFLLSPEGKRIAHYRKINLFTLNERGGNSIDEKKLYSAGRKATCTLTPFGKVGLTICYDLRFPELFRSLTFQGAEIIFVPSAFTFNTGKAHWEILLRTRAIENQIFIIAPNQYGKGPSSTLNYGHSMIVDPWGTIIARCQNGERIIYADLDLSYLKRVRKKLPVLNGIIA
jgi:predicted amidohydrolase